MKQLPFEITTLHTTKLGILRIQNNIGYDGDVITWCKEKILKPQSIITRSGKNWYVEVENYIFTINASSNTVITVHKKGKNK